MSKLAKFVLNASVLISDSVFIVKVIAHNAEFVSSPFNTISTNFKSVYV